MDGRNHPLEDDYGEHHPWSLSLFLEKDVSAYRAKRSVYA